MIKLQKRFSKAMGIFTQVRAEIASIISEANDNIEIQEEIIASAEAKKQDYSTMKTQSEAFALRLDKLINGDEPKEEGII